MFVLIIKYKGGDCAAGDYSNRIAQPLHTNGGRMKVGIKSDVTGRRQSVVIQVDEVK